MSSAAINEITRAQWRKLGFYYERDDESRTWRLLGSRSGLAAFAQALHSYAASSTNRQFSEHEHFGPYWYLEVGTWHHTEITDHWIAGPLEDIEALALRIEQLLASGNSPTVHKLRAWFAPSSPYELQLEVQPDGFDPALADPASNVPGT